MATIISRDLNTDQIFPVEILRSILPMVIAGLSSTQLRIRKSTYRFLASSSVLGGIRWLAERDGINLLRVMNQTRETLDESIFERSGRQIIQINDIGMLYSHVVESGKIHPTSLKAMVPMGAVGNLKWVWFTPEGNEFPLGKEDVFNLEQKAKIRSILEARVP
jgi:hypothetical protein